jgi:hypothetical protein
MKSRKTAIFVGTTLCCLIVVAVFLATLATRKAEAQQLRPITDEWMVKCYAGTEVIIDTAFYGPPIIENGMLVIETGGRTVRYVCAGNCVITHKRSKYSQG